ncbi:SLC13 family permease [Thiomicrorhabdus sp. Milos-T2]|uniref:SLC13 family permease n=1 Tax=Thiomicrorhabdus sp. Milos-T2 TaxID=90814 RepID=UPI00049469A4|nr:SLC13 family permease [Thiomicrorhabdus sp. Milos-T2]
MTTWLVFGTIIALLALLATGKIQPFKLFGGLVFIYYLSGLISLEEMLANFVNPALITLIALLLISFVLEKTNWISLIAKKLFVVSEKQSYLRMGVLVGLSSAFLNNTAVVATLLSSVKNNPYHVASKLLIPLSYMAILGGTLTLVGTSTNLIINGFVVQAGLPELGLFDFLYVGLPLLMVGMLIIAFISARFLPEIETDDTIAEQYFIEAKISPDSKVINNTVQMAGLRELGSLFLVQIYRNGQLISPVSPDQVIEVNDRLLFTGDIKEAPILLKQAGLLLAGSRSEIEQSDFVEVVLSHTSSLIGNTIKEAGFRNKFDAAVVAIKRGGQELGKRLADIELQPGDTLVLATGADFYKRENLKQNFYFYSAIESFKPLSNTKSLAVGLSFITVLGLAAFEIMPLLKGLMILLAGLFAFKLITFAEVKRRFPYELMIVIGSALGIATVMMHSGVSEMVASWVMGLFSGWGVMGSLIGVFLITLLLTEVITNNASAAIGFPIALATSELLGVSPWPFIMVVAYAASASFMTPYGYQTNLMVYGPGNYQFKHYIQAGLPLTIVYSIVVLILVPVFFPF